jgi:hypothetical protein
VNARSRRTINIDNETGFVGRPATERTLLSTDVSSTITSTNGVPILVERAMYMTVNGRVFAAGHDSAGVTAPQTSWFLAEGATGTFFDLFVLLANPTTTPTTVEITYLLSGGTQVVRQYGLAAQSRRTVYVDTEPGLANVATSAIVRSLNAAVPIVVERAMWWPGGVAGPWYEGHNSPGATTTGTVWALAEGEVGGSNGASTYILVANTGTSAASIRVTVYIEGGGTAVRTFTVPASSRFNVDVATVFGSTVANARMGALVESLGASPAPIVVERAIYSNAGGRVWAAGTNALATRIQ